MSIEWETNIDDLYKVRERAELVNGRIVMLPYAGGLPSHAAGEIMYSIAKFAERINRGWPAGGNVGFIVHLPHRKSFCPDGAYFIGSLSMKFPEGAPLFALEVRDEWDYGPEAERAMVEKRADYFAAGSQVVWDVDLLGEDVVRVHRSSADQPTIYRRGEWAEAEPALPGWKMPVNDLFLPDRNA